MGILDSAKDAVNKHEDKVDQGIEKGGDIVDSKTGDKHADRIDKVQQAAQDKTGNL